MNEMAAGTNIARGHFYAVVRSRTVLLRTNMPIADADPLVGRQLFQPHRPAGVQLLRADRNLGAQAELPAVVEARAGVDEDGRRIHLVDEARGIAASRW